MWKTPLTVYPFSLRIEKKNSLKNHQEWKKINKVNFSSYTTVPRLTMIASWLNVFVLIHNEAQVRVRLMKLISKIKFVIFLPRAYTIKLFYFVVSRQMTLQKILNWCGNLWSKIGHYYNFLIYRAIKFNGIGPRARIIILV